MAFECYLLHLFLLNSFQNHSHNISRYLVIASVLGTNSLEELKEDLATLTEEGKMDEQLLEQRLQVIQSQQGKEALKMFDHSVVNLRSYARRALEGKG